MKIEEEKEFLEKVSYTYKNNNSPISGWSIDSYLRIYKRYIDHGKEKRGLELGCSNGYSTEHLSKILGTLDVVDGSRNMIGKASERLKQNNVNFIYALFEEYDSGGYDYVFCSYVMEHVIEPEKVLEMCFHALNDKGKLFITVPNAMALSRQMAKEMGLIKDLYALTENDRAHGHRRVFDLRLLKNLVQNRGFKVLDIGGTFLKPYADFQLNQMIQQEIIGLEQLKGMQRLAGNYPELCGSIYAVLEKETL